MHILAHLVHTWPMFTRCSHQKDKPLWWLENVSFLSSHHFPSGPMSIDQPATANEEWSRDVLDGAGVTWSPDVDASQLLTLLKWFVVKINDKSCAAGHQAVGRTALLNFLSSNPDVVDICIDQCYSPDAAVARAYFQVKPLLGGRASQPSLTGALADGRPHMYIRTQAFVHCS